MCVVLPEFIGANYFPQHIICYWRRLDRVKKHIKLLSINSQSLSPFFFMLFAFSISLFLLSGNKSPYFVGEIWSFFSMVYYINKDGIDWNKQKKNEAENLLRNWINFSICKKSCSQILFSFLINNFFVWKC